MALQVKVKRIGGREPLELPIELEDGPGAVQELRRLVAEKSGVPEWAVRLFCAGRMLRGKASLSEQGVAADAQLLLAASAHYTEPQPNVTQGEPAASSSHADASAGSTSSSAAQAEASAGAQPVDISQLSVSELKRRLTALGVSYEGCTEKSELVALLLENEANPGASASSVPTAKRRPPPLRAVPKAQASASARSAASAQGRFAAPMGGMAWEGQQQGPPNPVVSLLQQLGPIMGSAVNQAFGGRHQGAEAPPAFQGMGVPMGVPGMGVPGVGVPGAGQGAPVGAPQPGQEAPWGPGPSPTPMGNLLFVGAHGATPGPAAPGPPAAAPDGAGGGAPPTGDAVAALLQQLTPQLMAHVGTAMNQAFAHPGHGQSQGPAPPQASAGGDAARAAQPAPPEAGAGSQDAASPEN